MAEAPLGELVVQLSLRGQKTTQTQLEGVRQSATRTARAIDRDISRASRSATSSMQSLAFGTQDLIQGFSQFGFTTQGLRFAMLGATNNFQLLIQQMGFANSAVFGLVAGLGAALIPLLVNAGIAISEFGERAGTAADELARLFGKKLSPEDNAFMQLAKSAKEARERTSKEIVAMQVMTEAFFGSLGVAGEKSGVTGRLDKILGGALFGRSLTEQQSFMKKELDRLDKEQVSANRRRQEQKATRDEQERKKQEERERKQRQREAERKRREEDAARKRAEATQERRSSLLAQLGIASSPNDAAKRRAQIKERFRGLRKDMEREGLIPDENGIIRGGGDVRAAEERERQLRKAEDAALKAEDEKDARAKKRVELRGKLDEAMDRKRSLGRRLQDIRERGGPSFIGDPSSIIRSLQTQESPETKQLKMMVKLQEEMIEQLREALEAA